MINEILLKINQECLAELKERLKSCQSFEYDAIMINIDRVNDRIEAIKNGTHGW